MPTTPALCRSDDDTIDFERLAADMKVRDLEQGEVLFHRGDPAHSFYFVDTGLVELSLISATGDKKTLEVVNPGRTFGEAVTFMQEVKYPVTAEALQSDLGGDPPESLQVVLVGEHALVSAVEDGVGQP